MILLQARLAPHPPPLPTSPLPPAPAVPASKRLFVICNVMFGPHRGRERERRSRKKAAFIPLLFILEPEMSTLLKLPLATSDLSLMGN